jgi:hypothetical protein
LEIFDVRQLKTSAINDFLWGKALNFDMWQPQNSILQTKEILQLLDELTPFQMHRWDCRVQQLKRRAATYVSVARSIHFQHGCCQTGSSSTPDAISTRVQLV